MISSAYIHIPFCNKICNYCDFPKMIYNKSYIEDYLSNLKIEILKNYNGEVLETLYIGGGTPSRLDINELKQLFSLTALFNKSSNIEFTIECNVEDLTIEKLDLFKEMGVNRLSIGVESFNLEVLNFLGREKPSIFNLKNALRVFSNVNVDIIYAVENETEEELLNDIDTLLELKVPHISCYSLIIEEHTVLFNKGIKSIEQDIDSKMFDLICNKLKGFNHYEVSNFAIDGFESRHNLVYWNNSNYYGFGMGASGYIDSTRYTNTLNIDKYNNGNLDRSETILSKKDKMQEEMFLGLRKIKGVNMNDFYNKYGISILDAFDIDDLIEDGFLVINSGYISIKNIYTSNGVLVRFIGEVNA